MAATLREHGIEDLRELGLLTDRRIEQLVAKAPAIGNRIVRDDWVRQAQEIYEELNGRSIELD